MSDYYLVVTSFLLALITIISIRWLARVLITIAQFPPGPWGLPIIGYIPWLGERAHETFVKLGRKYGGVFSVNLGGETVVVLNDWPTIKATLVDQPKHFDGRAKNVFTLQLVTEGTDVGFNDGPIWRKERKLVTKCLRSIGMGKKSMESVLMDAAQEINTTILKHDGNTMEMKSLFFKPILKLSCKMVSSHNLDDNQLRDLEKDIDVIFKAIRPDSYLNIFPWLRFVLPNNIGYNELVQSSHNIKTYFMELIDQHLTNQSDSTEDDFIDHYLNAIKSHNPGFKQDKPPYDVEHLRSVLMDLFIGGIDTTNATCLWGFLYLATYPQVQNKVQVEMDSIVGRQRSPNVHDFQRLPYLMATIMEVHRVASVGPLAIPHRVTSTSKVYNYTIPKDTTCLQNIYAVHRDPQLWEEPEVFRPERFLDDKNNVKWPPYLMPFSIGPRVCLGQDLAEMILRVVFSCLLHRFNFDLPRHLPRPTLEPDVGLTIKPYPYWLHITARNE